MSDDLVSVDGFEDPLKDYTPKKYDDPLEEALAEEPVVRIHHQPHATIHPDASVEEGIKQLVLEQVNCLMVEEEGKLLGVLTNRDILNKVALEPESLQKQVRDVMTANPVYVYEDDPTAAALCVMAVCGHRHVPVVDAQEHVIGIVGPQRVTEFLSRFFGGPLSDPPAAATSESK